MLLATLMSALAADIEWDGTSYLRVPVKLGSDTRLVMPEPFDDTWEHDDEISTSLLDARTLIIRPRTAKIEQRMTLRGRESGTLYLARVSSALPYRTLADLLAAARAKTGELSMASVGPGSTFQMGFGTFTGAANVNMIFVPFPGSAPAVNAALGQHVTSAFSGYAVVSQHIKAGTLRALAVATLKRIEPLPDVPTFDESGFKNLEVDNWFGVIAPEKTPKETLAQLSGWFSTALQAADVKARLAVQGLYPVGICGDEFAAFVRKRYDEYGEALRASGVKPQ